MKPQHGPADADVATDARNHCCSTEVKAALLQLHCCGLKDLLKTGAKLVGLHSQDLLLQNMDLQESDQSHSSADIESKLIAACAGVS